MLYVGMLYAARSLEFPAKVATNSSGPILPKRSWIQSSQQPRLAPGLPAQGNEAAGLLLLGPGIARSKTFEFDHRKVFLVLCESEAHTPSIPTYQPQHTCSKEHSR